MNIEIPKFATKEETFAFLRRNKDTFKQMKKAEKKLADGVDAVYYNSGSEADKKIIKLNEFDGNYDEMKIIKIEPIINTTNLLDSHMDVHIPKLWNRSLNNLTRPRILNQEHKGYEFKKIIDDINIIPKVELIDWSELGYNFKGKTEALIYPATVLKERNEYMFKHYVKGWVRNHSVEMFYVELFLAMNSESRLDKEERDNWEKYRPEVANGDLADEIGWFWAVTEAKEVGGAAVPSGSNYATPNRMLIDASSDKSTLRHGSDDSTHVETYNITVDEIKAIINQNLN